jgi:hypothetical protein
VSDAPQADLSFPGLNNWLEWDFTFGPGITPGAGSITVINVPGAAFPRAEGDLILSYDRERITLRNCRLGSGTYSAGLQGQQITYQILDRRWKWAFPTISGRYNIRKPDGTLDGKLEPWSVKSPRELATLCLEAMGESGFDVRVLPDQLRPAVHWNLTNAAQALQSLAESLACRVILGLDDRVKLVKTGVGQTLPDDYLPESGEGIDPDERPDALVWYGAPSRYQGPLELRPVGLDKDLKIKPIDELSYKPAGGWEAAYPGDFLEISDTKFKLPDGSETSLRAMALEWVYRAYQLIPEPDVYGLKTSGSTTMPRRRLVLGSTLVDTWTDGEGVKREKPAYLTGVCWHPRAKDYRNFENATTRVERLGFSIDAEKQIVQCSDFVYRFTATGDGKETPKLYLWTSYNILDEKTNQPLRWEKEKLLSPRAKANSKFRLPIESDGIGYKWKATFGVLGTDQLSLGKITENSDDLTKEAGYYLQAEAARYDVPTSMDRSYIGLRRFEPDGSLAQVTWSAKRSGCITRASLRNEHDPYMPRYREAVAAGELLLALDEGRRAFRSNSRLPGGAPG